MVADVLSEGTVVGGRYVLGACIGDGAMGSVYRAKHAKVSRQFAIKVLHRSLMKDKKVLRRFEREAELAGRLRHQNVVSVVDVGLTYNGLRYMAMELAPGMSLGQILLDGPLSESRALDIAKQLCGGLAHAHELGLIHRDFKPDNVLVEQARGGREVVRIVDFGVAILREDVAGDDEDRLTTKGLVVGTPHYMAPEQARGIAIDHRVDIYALGLILYEMLTGVLPFEGSGVDVARDHVMTEPPRMRERAPDCHVDEDLEAIVMRMLEKSPSDRYSSADEVLQALIALERDRSNPRARIVTDVIARVSRPHSVIEPELVIDTSVAVQSRSRRSRLRPAVVAAAAASLAFAALLLGWRVNAGSASGSVANIDVPSDESTAAVARDERIHHEAPPPVPSVLEQPDKHGIVEVPLPAQQHPTIPPSIVEAPTAQQVALLYGNIGRQLRELDSSKGMSTTIDLWPRYRWIRINDAMATAEKRMQATVMLQRLERDIRDASK